MSYEPKNGSMHSPAWIAFTQVNFGVTLVAVAVATWSMPVDSWVRAFLALGLLALVGSTITMTKTIRDVHELGRVTSKVEEAKVERLLMDIDPVGI